MFLHVPYVSRAIIELQYMANNLTFSASVFQTWGKRQIGNALDNIDVYENEHFIKSLRKFNRCFDFWVD